jgi:polysaccharide biosynthesis transport protein
MEQTSRAARVGGLTVLRRRLPVVLLCLVVVPAAALAYSLTREKEYTATASLLFNPPGADERLVDPTAEAPSTDPARDAATNLDLVGLEPVADRTAATVGRGLSGEDISRKVKISAGGRSNLVSIRATDPSPRFAARLANTFASRYIAFRRAAQRRRFDAARRLIDRELATIPEDERGGSRGNALRRRADELAVAAALQTGGAEQVQEAKPPEKPSKPKPLRNTLIGVFLGLLLGVAMAFVVERLDRRLKDPSEIEDLLERPIVGVIPKSPALRGGDGLPPLANREPAAFGMLRANLRYFNANRPVQAVMVTSATAREGKTTVALQLAVAAAHAGTNVLLIEADLRLPALSAVLDGSKRSGLSNVLAGDVNLEDILLSKAITESPNGEPDATLDVALAGTKPPPNPTDLIESDRMLQLLQNARERYELIVVDAPPMSIPDAVPLARAVDGVLAVIRVGLTTRESARHLRKEFDLLQANVLGVVINGADRSPDYYGYYADAGEPRERGRLTAVRQRIRS